MRFSTFLRPIPQTSTLEKLATTAVGGLALFLAGCTCIRPGPVARHADADADGIPDRRDCIVGKAAEVRTSAGLEVVTLVDGKPAENCPDTRRHRIAIATVRAGAAPQPIAEYNHDHRSCPLVLRELTVQRQGDLFSDGFLVVNGLSARRRKVVELKVPLTPLSRPSATPALCLRDLGAEITPGCDGPGERLLRCIPAAGSRLEPPYCLLEEGGGGATVAYVSGGSDDLEDGKSLSDACDIVGPSCVEDPLACSRHSDSDGVADCFDCRPFDGDVAPGKTEIPCSGKNEDCSLCSAEDLGHCADAFRDCLAGHGLPRSDEGEEPLFPQPTLPPMNCELDFALCRLSCGDPPHSCNDSNECTERDRCENGPCQGASRNGAACTPQVVPECKVADLGSGVCQEKVCLANTNAPDRSPCEGAATPPQCMRRGCVGGECGFVPDESQLGQSCVPAIADGNPCTEGRCDALGGCVEQKLGDGAHEGCNERVGQCSRRSCVAGACKLFPLTSGLCDDGNECTGGDQCSGGICQGAPRSGSCTPPQPGWLGRCSGSTCDGYPPAASLFGDFSMFNIGTQSVEQTVVFSGRLVSALDADGEGLSSFNIQRTATLAPGGQSAARSVPFDVVGLKQGTWTVTATPMGGAGGRTCTTTVPGVIHLSVAHPAPPCS